MALDIIGDVHGQASRLEALLAKMGYARAGAAWRHPTRRAVFVGDLIDGEGQEQLRTLEIVRAMVEAGSADAVLGNHELNALGWATRDPDGQDRPLRDHSPKNLRQHARFLEEVGEDSGLHRDWVEWLWTLPAWIETPALRVIHASWDPTSVEVAKSALKADARLTETGLAAAFDKSSPVHQAFETLLKGPELDLPEGIAFTDSYGHVRTTMRLAWWKSDAQTLQEAYWGPPGVDVPATPLPAGLTLPEPDRPTFFGHYWFPPDAAPAPAAPKAACVDYSAGKGGPLVAYRFDGEDQLSAASFCSA